MNKETVVSANLLDLEKFGEHQLEEGERRGRAKGIREGESQMLRRLVAHKFGSAGEEELSRVLAAAPGLDRMEPLMDAAMECDAAVEFLGRVREDS